MSIKKSPVQWTCVYDELPLIGKLVLVCDFFSWVSIASLNDEKNFEFEDGSEPGVEIAFWMPLPKVPKSISFGIASLRKAEKFKKKLQKFCKQK